MNFDARSFATGFLAGFIFANLLYLIAYRYRKQLGEMRDDMRKSFADLRHRLSSGTDTRYREDLVGHLQFEHLGGSILRLDDILVRPTFIVPPPPYQPEGENYEPDISDAVPVTPDLSFLGATYQIPRRAARDITGSTDDIILIGKLGSGKSTALQHFALEAARRNEDYYPEMIFPAYIHLGDLPLPFPEKGDLMSTFTNAIIQQVGTLTASALPKYLEGQLNSGRVLVMVDGLDELPEALHQPALDWIQTFRSAYPDNRYIVASDIHKYQQLINMGMAPIYICGWSMFEARQLVGRWVEMWPSVLKAQKRRYNPEDEIDPALIAGWLSGNTAGRSPFEITLKIWTGLAGDAEGPRQTDWLKTYVQRLQRANEVGLALETMALQTMQEGSYGLSRDELKTMISDAAKSLPAEERSSYDPLDLVDELSSRKGSLLIKRAGDVYTFEHPLIRGYLAARTLRIVGDDLLIANFKTPDWLPAQAPFATMADADRLAAAYLKAEIDILYSGLFQVADWLADAPTQARWRGEVLRRLAQVLSTSQAPVELRGRALSALVAAHDENVAKLLHQGLTSRDPVMRQMACIGLGAISDSKAVTQIASLLRDADLPVRWAAALALASIGNDDSLEALAHVLLEGDSQGSLIAGKALALDRTEGHAMLRDAMDDPQTDVRRAAVEGARRIGSEDWIIKNLETILMEDSDWLVRNSAESALNNLRERPINSVNAMPMPDQTDWLLTWYARKGRAVQPGQTGRTALREALESSDLALQLAATDHLGRISDQEATDLLKQINQRNRSNPEMREATYQALTSIARASGEPIPFA